MEGFKKLSVNTQRNLSLVVLYNPFVVGGKIVFNYYWCFSVVNKWIVGWDLIMNDTQRKQSCYVLRLPHYQNTKRVSYNETKGFQVSLVLLSGSRCLCSISKPHNKARSTFPWSWKPVVTAFDCDFTFEDSITFVSTIQNWNWTDEIAIVPWSLPSPLIFKFPQVPAQSVFPE